MNQIGHNIDRRLLERYSIYLVKPNEPDFDGSMLSPKELRHIGKHVESCHRCRQQVNQFQAEFSEIERTLNVLGLPDIPLDKPRVVAPYVRKIENVFEIVNRAIRDYSKKPAARKYLFAAAAALLVVLLMPLPFSNKSKQSSWHFRKLAPIRISYSVRGQEAIPLQDGIIAFNEANYGEAIAKLTNYLEANPQHAGRAFVNYLLGLSYLYDSQEMLARQPRAAGIDKAISFLKTAAALTESNSIRENCYWFTGKAILLKGDDLAAKVYFQKVIDMRGKKMREAGNVLQEIKRNVKQQ